MITYAYHVGNGVQVGTHGLNDLGLRHLPGQRAGSKCTACERLHGQVKNDFSTLFVGKERQVPGVRCAGQER